MNEIPAPHERRKRLRTGGIIDRIFDRVTEVMKKYHKKEEPNGATKTDRSEKEKER